MSRFVLAVCACVALCGVATASQVIHLDTRGLTRESSDIVIGRVGEQHSHWNAAHTMIVTDVTIVVDQALKGAPGTSITLTQVGGEVDNMRYSVAGSPSFTSGEEVLIFAWRDAAGRPQVDGLGQGKFEILRDRATGARTVRRSIPGLGISEARSLRALPEQAATGRVPLDDMVREIRAALAEAGR